METCKKQIEMAWIQDKYITLFYELANRMERNTKRRSISLCYWSDGTASVERKNCTIHWRRNLHGNKQFYGCIFDEISFCFKSIYERKGRVIYSFRNQNVLLWTILWRTIRTLHTWPCCRNQALLNQDAKNGLNVKLLSFLMLSIRY